MTRKISGKGSASYLTSVWPSIAIAPLSTEDLESPSYREGVSCPKCIDSLEPERRDRLEERRKQVALADARGDRHIGAVQEKN